MKKNEFIIERELADITGLLLKGKRFLTTAQLSKSTKPQLSLRTIQRRVQELKDVNSKYYLLGDKIQGYKLIPRNIDWESFKLQQQKKTAIRNPVLHTDIYSSQMANNINNLSLAIDRKSYVELINYSAVTSKDNKDYEVYPLNLIISATPYIYAYEKRSKLVKKFIIERIGHVEITNEKADIDSDKCLKQIHLDDFGFSVDKARVWPIELHLTNYAMTMFIRDHNHLNNMIKEIKPVPKPVKLNGEEYFYQYSLKLRVGSIRVIGRLMTGILDHVKVLEAPKEFKNALREYIDRTVLKTFHYNI